MQGITETVTVRVGARLFYTTRATLNKSPYFEALLKDLHGELPAVERDARAFKHVLSLLRDPSYPFPIKFRHELPFYGLEHEPITNGAPYLLPAELMHYADRGQRGPVQLVPMHQALCLVDFGDTHIVVEFTKDARASVAACWSSFFQGDSLRSLLVCPKHMPVFFPKTPARFKCITLSQLATHIPRYHTVRVVPVVTNLCQPHCMALLLVIMPQSFPRFQTLPSGATLQ